MNTYTGENERWLSGIDQSLLDLVKTGQEYAVYQGSSPLLTPMGKPVVHQSERLVRAMITDLQIHTGGKVPGVPMILFYILNVDGEGDAANSFYTWTRSEVAVDPFISIKTTGNHSLEIFSPDDPLFNYAFLSFSGLVSGINAYAASLMGEIALDESENPPFLDLVRNILLSLDGWKRALLVYLSGVHNSGIVLPLALLLGRITPGEYVGGLVAMKRVLTDDYLSVMAVASSACEFLSLLDDPGARNHRFYELVREGEGDRIEFKSTLRWDIRAGKTNPAIERACLKTISAFLNSQGGVLLIGVRDDGSVEGIETDKFVNEDKFLLHLWTLIRNCLGRDFSPYIRSVLEKHDNLTVCIVHCLPSNRPVFLRQPGYDEELYIRVGPSSNALDISEALKYIHDRFPPG